MHTREKNWIALCWKTAVPSAPGPPLAMFPSHCEVFFYLGHRAAFKSWEESQSRLFLGRPQDQRCEDVTEKSEGTAGKKLGCRRRNQSAQAGEAWGRGTRRGLPGFFRVLPSYLTLNKYPVLPKLREIGKAEVCWEEVIQNMAPVSGFRGNKCFCEKLGKIIMIGN